MAKRYRKKVDRREFIELGGCFCVGLCLAGLQTGCSTGPEKKERVGKSAPSSTTPDIPKIDKELCNGCGDCVPACEFEAITLVDKFPDDGNTPPNDTGETEFGAPKGPAGSFVVELESDLCIGCSACEEICPQENFTFFLVAFDNSNCCGDCVVTCINGAFQRDPNGNNHSIDADKCLHCGDCYAQCRFKDQVFTLTDLTKPKIFDRCTGCGECIRVCGESALKVDPKAQSGSLRLNGAGLKVAEIDAKKCTSCMDCIAACARKAISQD